MLQPPENKIVKLCSGSLLIWSRIPPPALCLVRAAWDVEGTRVKALISRREVRMNKPAFRD